MKIVDVTVETFHYRSGIVRDTDGHGHPGPEHDARQSLTTIVTDEGIKGYAVANITKGVLEGVIKPLLDRPRPSLSRTPLAAAQGAPTTQPCHPHRQGPDRRRLSSVGCGGQGS